MTESSTLSQPTPLLGSFRIRNVLTHVFYNSKLIRNCLVAGLFFGLLAALLTPKQYTASSSVLILNGPGGSPQDEIASAALGLGTVPKAVQSDAEIIKSDPVLRDAVRRMGAQGELPGHLSSLLPSLSPTAKLDKAVASLTKNVKIVTTPGSNIIEIDYTSPDRQRSVRTLQAIMDAYGAARRNLYSASAPEIQQQEVQRYAKLLNDLDAKIKAAQIQYGVLDIGQDVQLLGVRRNDLAQRTSQAEERAKALDAELAAARQRLAASPQQVFDSRETTNGTPNDDAHNMLLRLRQDRTHVAAQYQSNYPGLKELDAKIATAERQIKENSGDAYLTEKKVRNPDYDALTEKVSSLTIERASVNNQLQELSRQQDDLKGRVTDVRTAGEALGELLRQRDVLEGVYKQMALQQSASKLRNDSVENSSASLRVVQPPTAPAKGKSNAAVLLLAGIMLGAVAAVVASILSAVARQVFITPTEAEKTLRLPVITDLSVGQSDLSSPEGQVEVTRLATFLNDTTDGEEQLRLIQITSSGDHDGKVELALALGREFASGWGLPTLVIDLDGEAYPMLTAQARGRGKVDLAGRELNILQSDVPNLWAITQPASDDSPFTAPRLPLIEAEKIIHELRRRFRRIVMIAPRDFDSYGARRLYALADAHLLMVRSEKTRAPIVRALRDVVLQSGGKILGFVYTHRRFYIPPVVYRWVFE